MAGVAVWLINPAGGKETEGICGLSETTGAGLVIENSNPEEILTESTETDTVDIPLVDPGVITAVYVPSPLSMTAETTPKVEVTVTVRPGPNSLPATSRGVTVTVMGVLVDVETLVRLSEMVD